ncbi:MAG: type II toxin-antitoxin system VapC family toxin [Deltaproteobacteria bacterium]|nr:type II toxin-antitoxin system VapC family toxin [Deltaproteobacteria bacterium]
MADVKYLLDTNILSEPTRKLPHPGVMAGLERHEREVCTAAPVLHEMTYGVERMGPGRRRDHLAAFVARLLACPLPVLPYDLRAAQWHARERARLESLGHTPPFVDGQIAAIAATQGLTIVTRNVREFRIFAELVLEDWFEGQ